MDALQLVNLSNLMGFTAGRATVRIGLIDGPVALNHPDLGGSYIHEISAALNGRCKQGRSVACAHGTFVAGMLCAKRGARAPSICPACTFLVRPIFSEVPQHGDQVPTASSEELAVAIIECVDAGAHILNLSLAVVQPSTKGERVLEDALDYAARRGVISVASAGNQAAVGSTAITRHPSVVPVVACDHNGVIIGYSNLCASIGKQGLRAPGESIASLGADGKVAVLNGTSVATPFVTGAIALILSEFQSASASQVKRAITHVRPARRNSVVPPLLDAWAAYQSMKQISKE